MTVQELIEALEKVKWKDTEVLVEDARGELVIIEKTQDHTKEPHSKFVVLKLCSE